MTPIWYVSICTTAVVGIQFWLAARQEAALRGIHDAILTLVDVLQGDGPDGDGGEPLPKPVNDDAVIAAKPPLLSRLSP